MFDKDIKLTSSDGTTVLEVVGGTEGEKSIKITYKGTIITTDNQGVMDLLALACRSEESIHGAASAPPSPPSADTVQG